MSQLRQRRRQPDRLCQGWAGRDQHCSWASSRALQLRLHAVSVLPTPTDTVAVYDTVWQAKTSTSSQFARVLTVYRTGTACHWAIPHARPSPALWVAPPAQNSDLRVWARQRRKYQDNQFTRAAININLSMDIYNYPPFFQFEIYTIDYPHVSGVRIDLFLNCSESKG